MKVLIQGKQVRVSDELKSYVYDRLVTPLTRFFDDSAAELRVEFGDVNGPNKGGEDKECHLTLRMPGMVTIQIEETTPDFYASFDAASDRLIRQCHREIERTRSNGRHHKYRPLGTVAAEGGVPSGSIEDLGLLKQGMPSPTDASVPDENYDPDEEEAAVDRSAGEAEALGETTEA